MARSAHAIVSRLSAAELARRTGACDSSRKEARHALAGIDAGPSCYRINFGISYRGGTQ